MKEIIEYCLKNKELLDKEEFITEIQNKFDIKNMVESTTKSSKLAELIIPIFKEDKNCTSKILVILTKLYKSEIKYLIPPTALIAFHLKLPEPLAELNTRDWIELFDKILELLRQKTSLTEEGYCTEESVAWLATSFTDKFSEALLELITSKFKYTTRLIIFLDTAGKCLSKYLTENEKKKIRDCIKQIINNKTNETELILAFLGLDILGSEIMAKLIKEFLNSKKTHQDFIIGTISRALFFAYYMDSKVDDEMEEIPQIIIDDKVLKELTINQMLKLVEISNHAIENYSAIVPLFKFKDAEALKTTATLVAVTNPEKMKEITESITKLETYSNNNFFKTFLKISRSKKQKEEILAKIIQSDLSTKEKLYATMLFVFPEVRKLHQHKRCIKYAKEKNINTDFLYKIKYIIEQ